MLHELPPQHYDQLADLFALLDEHLAVASVLAGETPGQIFVDDSAAPRTAVLFPHNRHRVYLAGVPDNADFILELARLLATRYAAPPGKVSEFVVYYAPSAWDAQWSAIVPGALPAPRQYYQLDGPPAAPPPLPPGLTLQPIDSTLLADTRLRGLPQLIEEVHSESHSLADFLAHKLGYCARDGDLLAGWCLSEYNHGDRCELGVETLAQYQRQGIGTATVLATVAEARARGITRTGWHCWQRNTASAALARRACFAHIKDYSTWYCRLPA